MTVWKTLVCSIMLLGICSGAPLKVGSLHPLMGDLVQQVGGDRVEVVAIGKPGMDVHTFATSAKDLKALGTCQLVVASGKGLERYLPKLREALGGVPILEVGRPIPSQKVSGKNALYACCPDHSHGTIDPHWWHNVKNMERAVKVVEKELTRIDPSGKAHYQARSKEVRAQLGALQGWVKAQLAQVPKGQRKLVTAHAAFGYFCSAYRFEPVFVLGLSGDHEVPAQQLAEEVTKLKKEKIRAVFPEQATNPKVLKQIAQEVGAKIGTPLIADGSAESYDTMMRSNVLAIVSALKE